jgi:geranyl-CoA carboxylase beta subunit
MPVIQTDIDVHGADFAQNREAMLAAVASFRMSNRRCLNKAAEAKAKIQKRGQLLPRERLNLLLDPARPFWSWRLAGYKLHDDKDGTEAGGGIIAGIGYISRRALPGDRQQQRDQGRHHFARAGCVSPCACSKSPSRTNCRW